MKKEKFKTEISYIKNENYKKNAENLIELLPDYFFEVLFIYSVYFSKA